MTASLTNLRTGAIIHQVTPAAYGERFVFEFADNDLYRFAASGASLSPPGGDPEAAFSLYFYDRVTRENAEFAPVPEPASLLLLGSGAAAMFLRRRRTARGATPDASLQSSSSSH